MRRLLPLLALLLVSCRSPRTYDLRSERTPETAACVQQCGHLRNECAHSRWLLSWAFLWLGSVYVENACSAQFDHCLDACPGVGEAPAKRTTAPDMTPVR